MKNTVHSLVETYGMTHQIEGNQPLLLDNPDRIWFVKTGTIDVFSIEIKQQKAVGYRTHLFRAEEGELIFGFDLKEEANDTGLLAVGGENTSLMELERPVFERFLKSRKAFPIFVNLIERWIGRLSAAIGKKEIPPTEYNYLKPHAENTMSDGEIFGTQQQMIWVRPLKGQISFLGEKRWPHLNGSGFFPVVGNAWLQMVGDVVLRTTNASVLVKHKLFFKSLDSFHGLILKCASQNRKKDEQRGRLRLERREKNDHLLIDNALNRLSAILKTSETADVKVRNADKSLLEAIRLIGSVSETKVISPPNETNATLDDICRASRIRVREVCLQRNWWRRDNGPLLAYVNEDNRPVTLLPVSSTTYEICDPSNGSKRKLTEDLAMTLEPMAYSFYNPFPEKVLKGIDLLKFSMKGTLKDRNMIMMMGVLSGLLGLLTPVLSGFLFDSVIPNAAKGRLIQIVVIISATAVASVLFNITKSVAVLRINGKISGRVQAAVWDRLLSLPVTFFGKYSSGDLVDRSMCINAIQAIFDKVAVNAVLGCVFSSFNLILLFYYDVSLAFIALAITAIGMIFGIVVNLFQLNYQKSIQEIEGKNAGMVLQFLTGISKLRISGTEDRAFSLWAEEFARKKDLAFKAGTIQNIQACFFSSYRILSSMAIFSWIILSDTQGMSTGSFIAFTAAFAAFQGEFLDLVDVLGSGLSILPLYNRAKPIFEELPESADNHTHPGKLSGHIVVNQVNFRYDKDGPLILKDVSLDINPGDFIAIVGESGSGKSTLLRLLLGFETSESGSIFLDGQDLADLDIREVRRQTGVVLQNGSLMQGDIFKNIVGISSLTIDNAWEAARLVGLEDDIKEMPMGMHTMVTAGGGTLSGGQRQRMLIARAVVNRPRILYFDEATSALDNKTQAVVSQSLQNLKSTRIVIAHRLSTIINADRIYVLEKGSIVESGNYQELISNQGFFANLAKRQIA